MRVIGLTGKSGSGKSTVSQYFKNKYNAYIIDADKVGHQMLLKGSEAFDELIQTFGTEILDDKGDISRLKLRRIVFSDKSALAKLNTISHYYICKDILNKILKIKKYYKDEYSVIIVDAAVLLQSKLKDYVDIIWVVIAEEDNQISRLIARDNLSREDIQQRLSSQWDNKQYVKFADEVINNKTTLDELFETCDKLYKKYISNGGTE